jgi:hypothetical protein
MATDAQRGCREEHWTARRGAIAAVLASSLVPLLGLFVIVPCLLSAGRAGTSKTPYIVALVVGVIVTALVYILQAQVRPS